MGDDKGDKKSNLAGWAAMLTAVAAFITALGFTDFFPDLVKRFFAESSPQSSSSPAPQITSSITPAPLTDSEDPPSSTESSSNASPLDSPPFSTLSSETQLIKESSARSTGDPVGAIKILDEVIQNNPNSSEAYLVRALTHTQTEQCRKALEDYNQIIRIQPNSVKIYGSENESLPVELWYIYSLRAGIKAGLENQQAAIPDLEIAASLLNSNEESSNVNEMYSLISSLRKANFVYSGS
jgi:tetratricopeptide (TPR) repeat protein